jgi:hypothetical protein
MYSWDSRYSISKRKRMSGIGGLSSSRPNYETLIRKSRASNAFTNRLLQLSRR